MFETWKKKTLKELAVINYGKSPKEIIVDNGSVPVVGTGGVERFGKDYLYDGESVILGRKGTIDKPTYIYGKFWAIDTTYFLSDFNGADVKWLYYFLTTVDLRSMNEATGVPSLSRDFLYKIEIPTPPEDEQQQIAAILSHIDRAIEQTETLIAKQQRIKAGLMRDLLTKGIDEHGNIRSKATHEFKDSPLGRIPIEWSITNVLNVRPTDRSCIQTGPFGAQLSSSEFQPSGVPVLKIGNVQSGFLDLTNLDFVTESKAEKLSRFRIQVGDLLFARQGATTGRNALATHECVGWIINYHIIRVTVDHSQCLPYYLGFCFNSHLMQIQVAQSKIRGSREGINSSDIAGFLFPLPPISEQRAIVSSLLSITTDIENNEKLLKKYQFVKQGLMQDLLTGKVPVIALLKTQPHTT